jgi:probable phosphoglycerate mutase
MTSSLPKIYLARHGETLWSASGQHTGLSDIPLTEQGVRNARRLGQRLQNLTFKKVLSSPLQRTIKTAKLAGFDKQLCIDPDLIEWNYGDYEGMTTVEIQKNNPDWFIFRDGCPHGESPQQIAHRCDGMIQKLRAINGDILIFSHAHVLRMLTTRWLELKPEEGRLYFLNTGSLSILGYEHNSYSEPVIRLWNETYTSLPDAVQS